MDKNDIKCVLSDLRGAGIRARFLNLSDGSQESWDRINEWLAKVGKPDRWVVVDGRRSLWPEDLYGFERERWCTLKWQGDEVPRYVGRFARSRNLIPVWSGSKDSTIGLFGKKCSPEFIDSVFLWGGKNIYGNTQLEINKNTDKAERLLLASIPHIEVYEIAKTNTSLQRGKLWDIFMGAVQEAKDEDKDLDQRILKNIEDEFGEFRFMLQGYSCSPRNNKDNSNE